LHEYDQALEFYERSIAAAEQSGETHRQISGLSNSALALINLGRYSEAVERLESALAIRKDRGELSQSSHLYNFLGRAYRGMLDYSLSVENYLRAAELAEIAEDTTRLSWAYNNIGITYLYSDSLTRAREYYEKALSLAEEINDPGQALIPMINLGSVYLDLRDFATSEKYALEVLELSRERDDLYGICLGYLLLGYIQNHTEQLDAARGNFLASIELARDLNDDERIWTAQLGLAESHDREGDQETALIHYDDAFRLLSGMTDEMQKQLRNDDIEFVVNYVLHLYRSGRYSDAQNQMNATASTLTGKGWDVDVFRFYNGSLDEESFLLAAEKEHPDLKEGHLSEAWYYLGMAYRFSLGRLRSASPDTIKQQEFFERSMGTRYRGSYEGRMSELELERRPHQN